MESSDAPQAGMLEFSDDEEPDVSEEPPPMGEYDTVSALDDVPAQLHRDKRASAPTVPTTSPPKRVRFEEAKEATEKHLSKMKAVLRKYEPGVRTQEDGASPASNSLPSSSVATTRPGVDSGNYQEGGASASNSSFLFWSYDCSQSPWSRSAPYAKSLASRGSEPGAEKDDS